MRQKYIFIILIILNNVTASDVKTSKYKRPIATQHLMKYVQKYVENNPSIRKYYPSSQCIHLEIIADALNLKRVYSIDSRSRIKDVDTFSAYNSKNIIDQYLQLLVHTDQSKSSTCEHTFHIPVPPPALNLPTDTTEAEIDWGVFDELPDFELGEDPLLPATSLRDSSPSFSDIYPEHTILPDGPYFSPKGSLPSLPKEVFKDQASFKILSPEEIAELIDYTKKIFSKEESGFLKESLDKSTKSQNDTALAFMLRAAVQFPTNPQSKEALDNYADKIRNKKANFDSHVSFSDLAGQSHCKKPATKRKHKPEPLPTLPTARQAAMLKKARPEKLV